ncbi:MAG: carbohydrate kinase family protein [Candidatus Thermoplasmatota archaeon]|nr:carbohydrate kinase family protein [Candidatus Thermoplasmatota archaeon]
MDGALETMLKRIVQEGLKCFERYDTNDLKDYKVVLLPDFFIDHIVSFPDFKEGMSTIQSRFMQGGGNIPGLTQVISQGGNAANTALALARLGVHSHLICRTDKLGIYLIEYFLKPYGVDISHAKGDGKNAYTVALEFGKNHSNVFLQDPGSVTTFGVDDLNTQDWELIRSAHLVGVMNWSMNRKGTYLASHVFEYAKNHDVKTYIDTGDPSPRSMDIDDFLDTVFSKDIVDIMSLNENEIRKYSGHNQYETNDEIYEAGRILHQRIRSRLDVHTARCSYSITNSKQVCVDTVPLLKVYRATGAGDVWNAGNIIGELLDFSFEQRLAFANLVAACYISKKEPIPPSSDEIKGFAMKLIEDW